MTQGKGRDRGPNAKSPKQENGLPGRAPAQGICISAIYISYLHFCDLHFIFVLLSLSPGPYEERHIGSQVCGQSCEGISLTLWTRSLDGEFCTCQTIATSNVQKTGNRVQGPMSCAWQWRAYWAPKLAELQSSRSSGLIWPASRPRGLQSTLADVQCNT